ncbi:MAG: UDP-N-acetylglucosamine--LPS N-acetylglucosamine transferase [Actinomyces sp.]|nr:MAG: UDP-N-acetylglucosamine--LPS N-acetylglucosamine transferase [Actinomyces sp.]
MGDTTPRRVLAVASSGGHWVQLRRLRPAFRGQEVVYVTVRAEDAAEVDDGRCRLVPDATRWDRLRLVRLALTMAWILVRERPDVVVSTGAAPGYLALRLGRLLGARTVWVDSMANAEELSLSGRRIGPHADLWLTQWPHLARPGGPDYRGQVV